MKDGNNECLIGKACFFACKKVCMEEKDFLPQIEKIKTEWFEKFKLMQKYYESEVFKSFKIEYE